MANTLQPDASVSPALSTSKIPSKRKVVSAAAFSNGHSMLQRLPKVYAKPTIIKTLSQVLLHVLAGLIFASIVRPKAFHTNVDSIHNNCYNENAVADLKLLFYASCAFTSAFIFMATYYASPLNNYHELSFDKKTLPMISISELFQVTYMDCLNQIQASGLLFYWITSPLIATSLIYVFKNSDIFDSNTIDNCLDVEPVTPSYGYTLSLSYIITFLMSIYMISTDIMTRKFFIARGVDFFHLVNNAIMLDDNQNDSDDYDDQDIAMEELVISVILGGFGNDILEDVSCPRIVEKDGKFIRPTVNATAIGSNKRRKNDFNKRRGWVPSLSHEFSNVDIESEEVRRNKVMMDRVALSILSGSVCSHISFGHELLKYVLLEAFGGGEGPFMQDSIAPYGISKRNYRYISKFFFKMDLLGLVSIVRGLCAYSGGIGEALCRLSLNQSSKSSRPSYESSTSSVFSEHMTFYLSSSTCESATHAIKASTRFIILNMKNEKRLNRLSLLIPVVLESIHKLRCGVIDYVHYLYDITQSQIGGGAGETFSNFLTLKCPQMANILTACDDCGLKIVQFMKTTDRSTSEINAIKVDDKVKQWLQTLV